MRETKQRFADDEGEETMVAPRFDDEETMVARPVVPFEEVGDAPAVAPVPASAVAAPPPYSSQRGAPRRSLVAVLVLVSALVGSVLGVAGLYFYQNRNSADAPAAEQQQQAEAPAAQATTETVSEAKGVETSAPAPAEPPATTPAASEPEDEAEDAAKDKDSDEADASPVAERRGDSEERAPVATPKRGKKGARDEEIQRVRRAPRYDDDDSRPVARDEVSDNDGRREARRVGVITYRPRRVRERRGRDDSPDRLRRIFEGQP